MNITRTLSAAIIGVATIGSLGFALPAFAQGPNAERTSEQNLPRPAVAGIVASVSGTSLTVTSQGGRRDAATTAAVTYTVDAANATITKNGASSSLSAIVVGDHVAVLGSVTGTHVTATSVNDGRFLGRSSGTMMGKGLRGGTASSTRPMMNTITGNGDPIIAGSVTTVSGTTLTVTTKSGTAYTVNAASTTVMKMGATAVLSNIASGDNVVVQGTVNGTSVTASSIIDQGTPPTNGEDAGEGRGFFHDIGGFFMHMFGF